MRPLRGPNWAVPREWPGECCFIVAGGPSVLACNLDRLRGRKVIAVNSSYERVPFADYLLFSDNRWWREHRERAAAFAGQIVSLSELADWPRLRKLSRRKPPGLSSDPRSLTMRRTSLAAAINLAVLLGATTIVLLGADGKDGADGRTHHHEPHPWPQKPDCWVEQTKDLATLVEPLRELNVAVLNASPDSAWTFWPRVSFDQAIGQS
jgi:hypothetical protein